MIDSTVALTFYELASIFASDYFFRDCYQVWTELAKAKYRFCVLEQFGG